MRAPRSLVFSLFFLVLTTFTAAWPWPRWLPELDSLVVRQNDNNQNNQSSGTRPQATPTNASPSRSSNNAGPSITDPPSSTDNSQSSTRLTGSGSNAGSQTGSGTGSRRTTSATRTRTSSFDARLPAGGVSLMTPSVMDGEQYYKIGDHVTFAWNYTSLLATPTAVNIMATCTANSELYTLAVNQTVTNSTQSVVWDTGAYQRTALSDRLLTSKYTLIIYDAASSISANAQPGYLAVYNQYSFGMYEPQLYVPLGEYVCVTCSGALGDMERRMLGMVFGMCLLTVLSFTWFVAGTGVIW